MTREEAKEMLPIIKAFCEGKQIQFLFDEWKDIDEIGIREFLENPELYRIKPEPKYRPFRDAEECWQEMLRHEPFGWLYGKESDYRTLVTSISKGKEDISINGIGGMSLDAVMKYYTFVDGTPFGVKVEE